MREESSEEERGERMIEMKNDVRHAIVCHTNTNTNTITVTNTFIHTSI
jgi:metal-dependent HD superfamily phosphatase/phosphodiesterase